MPDDTIKQRHREGFEELNKLWKNLDDLETAVEAFAETSLAFVQDNIERALAKLRAFEPSVSVIGQVKAGKSTLLNALVGVPDLLPSDVNPWTSVITSLHLNSRHRPPNTRAVFRFFDAHEWDRLVATGGKLGEMATRAGFSAEAGAVREQVTEMRRTTESRFGDEFARLLGASHALPDLDRSTIDRYICYGDPEDMAEGAAEGVYADITKSADLYFEAPDLPKGMCLRDTPGVNDTFMMREQITLNAISDSRVCIVALSAHQALSTMDIALLRIICAVDAREVLIFVNRIDELADPLGESKKIRSSIKRTLTRLGLADDIEILFGSGYWANSALSDAGRMAPRSRASLASLFPDRDLTDPAALRSAALEGSGVPALHRAIVKRIVEGPGKAFLNDIRAEIDTIIAMSETVETAAHQNLGRHAHLAITAEALDARLTAITSDADTKLAQAATDVRVEFRAQLERAQQSFVASAIDALRTHIGSFGEHGQWTHDPITLRMMMKTAYNGAVLTLRKAGEDALETVLDGVQDLLQEDFDVFRAGESFEFPEQPQHKVPTVLARTISLDLKGDWWRRFWRFGSAKAAENRYIKLIVDETTPLVDDLIRDFFDPAVDATRAVVTQFADDQSRFCQALLARLTQPPSNTDGTPSSKPDLGQLRRLSA